MKPKKPDSKIEDISFDGEVALERLRALARKVFAVPKSAIKADQKRRLAKSR